VNPPGEPFASATRRAIAYECRDAALTIETMCRSLGWSDGRVRGPVKQLTGWSILSKTTNPAGRGFVYAFNERDWGDALDAALRRHRPGLIIKGQRVFVVGPASVPAAEDFIRKEEHEMVWAARLTPTQLLLAAHPETKFTAAKGLKARLQLAGARAELFTIEEIEAIELTDN